MTTTFKTKQTLAGNGNVSCRVQVCPKSTVMASVFQERTPMSTLTPTPITASLNSHLSPLWLCNPVAIAGHNVRPHSNEAGFFKLQLQCCDSLIAVVSSICHWSCNLQKIFSGYLFTLTQFLNPDVNVVFASSYATLTHSSSPLLFTSSRKCWILSADSIL